MYWFLTEVGYWLLTLGFKNLFNHSGCAKLKQKLRKGKQHKGDFCSLQRPIYWRLKDQNTNQKEACASSECFDQLLEQLILDSENQTGFLVVEKIDQTKEVHACNGRKICIPLRQKMKKNLNVTLLRKKRLIAKNPQTLWPW